MSVEPSVFSAVIRQYQKAFAAHGESTAACLYPKDRGAYRYAALTSHFGSRECSVLDYGCGLAHLKEYFDSRGLSFSYTGADMVPEFIERNRIRHPDSSFYLVTSPQGVPGTYDHVVISGIFNTLYVPDEREHFEIVKEILRGAFAKSRLTLCADFQSDHVDYRQPGAYHQDVPALLAFVRAELSRRLRLDFSYMPFEFALIVFKDDTIQRPLLTYRAYGG